MNLNSMLSEQSNKKVDDEQQYQLLLEQLIVFASIDDEINFNKILSVVDINYDLSNDDGFSIHNHEEKYNTFINCFLDLCPEKFGLMLLNNCYITEKLDKFSTYYLLKVCFENNKKSCIEKLLEKNIININDCFTYLTLINCNVFNKKMVSNIINDNLDQYALFLKDLNISKLATNSNFVDMTTKSLIYLFEIHNDLKLNENNEIKNNYFSQILNHYRFCHYGYNKQYNKNILEKFIIEQLKNNILDVNCVVNLFNDGMLVVSDKAISGANACSIFDNILLNSKEIEEIYSFRRDNLAQKLSEKEKSIKIKI